MVTKHELLAAVDAAFDITGRGHSSWPDPHPRMARPDEDEYSRLTSPSRWRIIGARVDAWFAAIVESGIADLERDVLVQWRDAAGPVISRTDRVVPRSRGALTLVVARSRLGDIDDAGVVLGAGDPAVCMAALPHCGCDACDSGSHSELETLDWVCRG